LISGSDITTAEHLTLCGKQDGFNSSAKTLKDYQYGTPKWGTELYDTCGTVQTLDSYITPVKSLPGNRNYTPELKTPPAQVSMPFNGYTQEQYARDMLNTFIKRGVAPNRVWAQSFNPPDIFQWVRIPRIRQTSRLPRRRRRHCCHLNHRYRSTGSFQN
jgi:glycerophosphoryl diester phosphodiesterase